MEATDIIEICEYILKQRELAVEKDESEDWVFEYLRHIEIGRASCRERV